MKRQDDRINGIRTGSILFVDVKVFTDGERSEAGVKLGEGVILAKSWTLICGRRLGVF
jgi:hypothetical protein